MMLKRVFSSLLKRPGEAFPINILTLLPRRRVLKTRRALSEN
jgi:hypothetical protein